MRIVVAGGTGVLGRQVADAVRAAGHDPVPVSRRSGTDLLSGEGLADLLRGASAVIDASSTNTISTKESVRFFGTVTRNLLAAERAAGVPHHVGVSIIGAAKLPAYYYAGKALQENILMAEQGGWSLLRTTQFHEFAAQLAARGKAGPLQIVPSMRSQPIAAAEVAVELVGIALGKPRGLEPDLAGPRAESMTNMVRRYLAATGQRRPVVGVSMPGAWGRGMRDGSILPGPGARFGRQSFQEWLVALRGTPARL
jgi:uncharacterized protein YbjT (DUF2867 family)